MYNRQRTWYRNSHKVRTGYVTIPHFNILTIVDIGVYTIDCEMCYTRQDLEIIQITIVNMN